MARPTAKPVALKPKQRFAEDRHAALLAFVVGESQVRYPIGNDASEARNGITFVLYRPSEHVERPDPNAAILGLVHHKLFTGFAVGGDSDDCVNPALVMADGGPFNRRRFPD